MDVNCEDIELSSTLTSDPQVIGDVPIEKDVSNSSTNIPSLAQETFHFMNHSRVESPEEEKECKSGQDLEKILLEAIDDADNAILLDHNDDDFPMRFSGRKIPTKQESSMYRRDHQIKLPDNVRMEICSADTFTNNQEVDDLVAARLNSENVSLSSSQADHLCLETEEVTLSPSSITEGETIATIDDSPSSVTASPEEIPMSPNWGNRGVVPIQRICDESGEMEVNKNFARTLEKYPLGPHPVIDYENIIGKITNIEGKVGPPEKTENITQVLVLGGTGHMGRWILKSLVDQNRSHLIIHCIVRANKASVAKVRIRDSLVRICGEEAADVTLAKCRLWCGDVTTENFGMKNVDYEKLVKRVEGIYIAIGPDIASFFNKVTTGNDDSLYYYRLLSVTMTQFWSHLFKFASTRRSKHIWAFTPIITSVKAFAGDSEKSKWGSLIESQINPICLIEDAKLSVNTNIFDCLSSCALLNEAILRHARNMSYSVTIFRLPPTSFLSSTSAVKQRRGVGHKPFSWIFLQAIVKSGLFPDVPNSFIDLLSHSLDNCVEEAVSLSLAKRRIHWIYHIVDPRKTCALTK